MSVNITAASLLCSPLIFLLWTVECVLSPRLSSALEKQEKSANPEQADGESSKAKRGLGAFGYLTLAVGRLILQERTMTESVALSECLLAGSS